MKTKVSRWQRFEYPVLNINKRMAVVVFIVSALSVDLACAASGGFIKFRGYITQASCEARNASQANTHERVLRVSPGVNITVSTADNVCSHPAVPFTLAYKPLPLSVGDAAAQARSGVVTMTYD
ncbi:hypothetical protein ACCD10_22205 [Pseudomonas sp. Pseusp122]|uniref:hypothetical protein n=1 Tax=unclassified Pseudomonas TaxID=196821 RepID=UPI0039A5E962